MTIHSIITDEHIFAGIEQLEQPDEVTWHGMLMQVMRTEGGKARIVRVISPDPYVYLDQRLYPGQEIDLCST